MLLVLLFPMFVKAAEIVDNDAKIKYTVDENGKYVSLESVGEEF